MSLDDYRVPNVFLGQLFLLLTTGDFDHVISTHAKLIFFAYKIGGLMMSIV